MKLPMVKLVLALVILPIMAVIIVLLGYNFVEIRPKIPEIKMILQNASPQDRNPPELIKTLIDRTPNSKNFVIYELLRRFYSPASQEKWHIRQLL